MAQHFDQYQCFAASTARQNGTTVIAYNALLGADGIHDLTQNTYDLIGLLNPVVLNKDILLGFQYNLEVKLADFVTKYQDAHPQDLKEYIQLFTKSYQILIDKL